MRLAAIALAVVLSIEPSVYRVSFPASDSNYSIILIISSTDTGRPYYVFNEVPILDADQYEMDIPRRALPRGHYHILVMLMYWYDGATAPSAVDSTQADLEE